MKLGRSRWIALGVVGVVAADWLSKLWVQNRVFHGSIRSVVDGWVWLSHRTNRGVSGSVLAGMDSPWRTPLLAVAACAGIAVALRILRSSGDAWVRWSAGLVIAGALGNLGDRVMDGAVTDFILVRFFPFVFNVADVAIAVGAVVLAARLARETGAPAADTSTAS